MNCGHKPVAVKYKNGCINLAFTLLCIGTIYNSGIAGMRVRMGQWGGEGSRCRQTGINYNCIIGSVQMLAICPAHCYLWPWWWGTLNPHHWPRVRLASIRFLEYIVTMNETSGCTVQNYQGPTCQATEYNNITHSIKMEKTFPQTNPHKTSTAKQVLVNCERMVLVNLIGNRLSTFILWIWLSTCTLYFCTVVLCC